MKLATIALVLAAAVAAPAFAEDADAETKFHRAYEAEVVEGKVADAARVYLEMLRDEKVPERLRAEAKFRFAVTAVLLGRADEARVHFAELARDTKVPESLRARAGEYLDAAKTIGVGSELDRKMQSLVFDLAKDTSPTPAAYRDFEVIGRRAVPFLRQLLMHEDEAIQGHAFRLLMRMSEPDLASAWTPRLTANNPSSQAAFARHLDTRPQERAVFEERLLALDDATLRSTLGYQTDLRTQFSAASLRALAARKVPAKTLVTCIPTAPSEDVERVRSEWIVGEDSALSTEATFSYLSYLGGQRASDVAPRTELFPAVVKRLASGAIEADAVWSGLARLAAVIPLESRLDTVSQILDRASTAEAPNTRSAAVGLVRGILVSITKDAKPGDVPARFAALLKDWFLQAARGPGLDQQSLRFHVREAIPLLPRDVAQELATWIVTTDLPNVSRQDAASAVVTGRPADVPLAMAALGATDDKGRAAIVAALGLAPSSTNPSPETVRAVAPFMPDLVRLWADAELNNFPPISKFIRALTTLPLEDARRIFVETAEALASFRVPGNRQQALVNSMLGMDLSYAGTRVRYWRDVALPSLDLVWTKLASDDRVTTLRVIVSLIQKTPRETGLDEAIARFVSARYAELPGDSFVPIAQAADLFPLVDWVPLAGVGSGNYRVSSDRADPVVRELTKDAGAVQPSVLGFTAMFASPAVQTDVFDRLLRTAPAGELDQVLKYAKFASTDACEDALRRATDAAQPDLGVVAQLVRRLRESRPSERLFPAIRLLLKSSGPLVVVGTESAKALGREELLPDLADLLDSMDENVRTQAKAAIDAIAELRKLKEETKRRAEGK